MTNFIKKVYKGISGMLIGALLISAFSGMVFAGSFSDENDPLAGRASGQMTEGFYDAKVSLKAAAGNNWSNTDYIHNTTLRPYLAYQPERIRKGIDVSSYNGNIDWNAVKADPQGISFAIIRSGYRGYNNGVIEADASFAANLQGALSAGLGCGIYFFSQAVTVEEARQEANYVISQLSAAGVSQNTLSFPVFIDVEYAVENGVQTGRLSDAKLSARTQTDIVNAFISQIEAAGYKAGVYGNKSMLKDQMYPSMIRSTASVWMANYTAQSDYPYRYDLWQCSDSGQINGISGNTDLNYYYEPEVIPDPAKVSGFKQSKASKSAIAIKWKKSSDADGYQIYRSTAKNGKYKKVKTIQSVSVTKWTNRKLAAGTEYYYKIRAYKKTDSGTKYSEFSSPVTMHTKAAAKLTVRTKKAVVMRADAGTAYKKKVKVPKNKKFTVISKTKDKSGKSWYKIKYKAKKKSYTGYIPASGTKKI